MAGPQYGYRQAGPSARAPRRLIKRRLYSGNRACATGRDIRGGHIQVAPAGDSKRIDCLEYADAAALIGIAVQRYIE